MKIGLAQTRFPKSLQDGIEIVKHRMTDAATKDCDIVCFPESILPGLRGVGYEVEPYDHDAISEALKDICQHAKRTGIAVILPTEWKDEQGLHMVAFVISKVGEILGYQSKNQMDPEEDDFGYVPGVGRTLFEIEGVKFGIVICHEGWRYPETVRWAARREASIVFHPQFTGDVHNPEFFNHAMICRSQENHIYFASVNYALESQQSTSALISPKGVRLCEAAPSQDVLLVHDIDPTLATRLLATRFRPDLL